MKLMRWIDLSAYGMRLYVAVLPTTNVFVIDNVPAEHEKDVAALGFKKGKSGSWVKPGPIQLNPREYLRLFPKAVIRNMERHEYAVHLNQPVVAGPEASTSETSSKSTISEDVPVTIPLGINRMGQKVFEENGRRHIVDSKGRQIREDALGTPMPGMFLRSIDDGSMAMCAEGFIETAIEAGAEPFAVPANFMKAIGVPAANVETFRMHVAEAVVRRVVKKGGLSLRDRFGKAIDIRTALGSFDLPSLGDLDNVIVARRLLGMDKDIVGSSVHMTNGNNDVLEGLLPQAVRVGDSNRKADISITFPKTADEALALLAERDNGRTISFIPVKDLADAQESAARVGAKQAVESLAYVSLGDNRRVLVASTVVADPSASLPEVREITDSGELWSWASVIATERSRLIEATKSGLATDADLNKGDGALGKNSHQVPYASASKVGKPLTMVPKELEGPTRQALDRLIRDFGDVDDRVAVECGFPKNELGEILSPEQVDAVAMFIHAEARDRAALIADSTGVGKGRSQMAIVKRAILQGRKVLVLTERGSNLSDLQRDVKHIRALDVIKPAVMNRDVALIDEATGDAFEVADQAVLLDAVERGVWPEGIDCIYATYSQFNKAKEESTRSAWLHTAIDSDVLVVADEIHNAASGDSNTSENIAKAIETAGSVVMSSATFAGNAKMMSFFERVFPAGLSGEEISAMMRKGGEPFQEVVSSMLVADGVMIRREKDLSSLKITQHLDDARLQRNRDQMDKLAAVIGEMALLSGDLDQVVNDHNRNKDNALKGLQMKRMSFGSPLYTLTRLFTASLLSEFVAERAIIALQNGEKPIVLVENTLQGILDEAAGAGGDSPEFKDVVHRVLDQITKITVMAEEGPVERIDAAERTRTIAEAIANIRVMISELPSLPASAIDEVKNKIRAAGFSCGEITGRTLEVVDGKVRPRHGRDTTKEKNSFNSGKLDALIINAAGSTGIDLHASARFKDQRRRVMIELQGPSYVLKQIQAYGRISRYDEVVPSRIELPSTGLPSEARLAAMRNQKLRRLSANVTSNRDSAYLAKNIPDLINSVGDAVISRYAEMRPDLMKRLCLGNGNEEDDAEVQADKPEKFVSESIRDSNYSANLFLSRLQLLPSDHQEKVLSELIAEYELHVAELEARGENPLRPRELEGIVHIRSEKLFEGSVSSESDSAFDGPLHLLDVSIERIADPVRAETVMKEVEIGSAIYGRVKKAAASLHRNRDMYLEPFLPKKARSVHEALMQGNKRITQMVANIDDLAIALECLAPGRELEVEWTEGEKETAVITSIQTPPQGYQHLPHMYRVDLAIPGAINISSFRLDSLLAIPGVSSRDENGKLEVLVKEGLEGSDYDGVLDKFENAVARKHTYGRILSTNIFRAVRLAAQHGLGSLVSFVDSKGNRHRGVLIKKGFERKLDMLSVRVEGVHGIMYALQWQRAEISSSPSAAKNSLIISPFNERQWSVKLPLPPKRGGEVKWPSEAYQELFHQRGSFTDGKSRFIADGLEDLRHVIEILSDAGYNAFYTGSKHRDQKNVHDEPANTGMAL